MTPLKLDVDKIDEEKLREQEELLKERAYPGATENIYNASKQEEKR